MLSLRCLPGLIDNFPQRQPVINLIEVADKRSEFARDWRNRYLAHRDRQLALNTPGVRPLAPATVEAAQEAIDAITAVLAHVEGHYRKTLPTTFERVSHLGDGVRIPAGSIVTRDIRSGRTPRAKLGDPETGEPDLPRRYS
jgi:hypothetical protein